MGTVAAAQDGGQALVVDRHDSVQRDVVRASLRGPEVKRPQIIGPCNPRSQVKLAAALRLAAQRVLDVPACAALFSVQGADGLERLRIVHYRSAVHADGLGVCRRGRGAAAFTLVGSPVTTLCPAFEQLTVESAAVVVLHEALHYAGLTEWPLDPDAQDSRSINQMVRVACGL